MVSFKGKKRLKVNNIWSVMHEQRSCCVEWPTAPGACFGNLSPDLCLRHTSLFFLVVISNWLLLLVGS